MTFWHIELSVPSVPKSCAVDGRSASVRRKLIPPLTSCPERNDARYYNRSDWQRKMHGTACAINGAKKKSLLLRKTTLAGPSNAGCGFNEVVARACPATAIATNIVVASDTRNSMLSANNEKDHGHPIYKKRTHSPKRQRQRQRSRHVRSRCISRRWS
jgi:hypothetical protein